VCIPHGVKVIMSGCCLTRVGKCSEMQHLPDRVKYIEVALLKERTDQQTKYINN